VPSPATIDGLSNIRVQEFDDKDASPFIIGYALPAAATFS
jgi:hypothetical protein